ncbi:MAG: SIS domain-containing protein [Clostridia bacterium]|nr:SIS domain-containing protein [Clostridia bacterium]
MTHDTIFETLYQTYPSLRNCGKEIAAAYGILKNAAEKRALIMVCGNGGSAADCEHITGELMKGFNLKRPLPPAEKAKFDGVEGGAAIADKLQGAIRCISLVSQVGVISAFANDIDPALVYAQQVWGYAASPDDVLISLSTSGNSENVVNAAKTAKAAGARTLAITGEADSALSLLCDVTVKLPAHTPFAVQELTLPVYHALCAALEAELFAD